ncbi:gliding motility lipoprotein GldB [Pedobacter sp. JCM 36344]|uniref:gliding motility lipoprotein GldB n=1 Tax=Pedobacter sp. JCM 36344 TaxID=3374280 RepID=UPI00397A6B0F
MMYNAIYRQSYLFFLLNTINRQAGNRFILPALLSVFVSCKQNSRPDVSGDSMRIKVERFDEDLFVGKGKDIIKTDVILKKKYGTFYRDYITRIVGDGNYSGPQILSTLYKDKAYTDLNNEASSVFPNMKNIESDLAQAFKYIKYYYPKSKTPKFISFISGFAVQTPIGDDYLGIGLDMFLGKKSKFYRGIVKSIPVYISRRFSPEYVVPRLTETFAREELFSERDEDRTLISKMIHNGKILYFMDQVLSEALPDSLKIGYTSKQLEWCKTYEADIWGFFLENNLLFETDYQKIQVYLSEGPFTPGLGDKNQSAPKLGIWMGWQIVRKYMEENKEVTLQQLMAETDEEFILNRSKYKPK